VIGHWLGCQTVFADMGGMADPDYIVEIEGITQPDSEPEKSSQHTLLRGRRWLAILWRCCSVYSRAYRNRAATAYEGVCPRCGRVLHVPIGPEGTKSRFFEAM